MNCEQRCPLCQHPIGPSDKFCGQCGRKVTHQPPRPVKCPKCNNKIGSEDLFCTKCGYYIGVPKICPDYPKYPPCPPYPPPDPYVDRYWNPTDGYYKKYFKKKEF